MGNVNAAGGEKWTEDHDAALKKHIGTGLSFAEVADEINREFGSAYSRNAAIGRAGRIGLKSTVDKSEGAKRHKGPRKVQPRPEPLPKPKPITFACEPVTGLRVADVVPRNIPLLELQPGECRWPYGNSPFVFCGHPTFGGCSYCEQHLALSRGLGTESERRATQGIAA